MPLGSAQVPQDLQIQHCCTDIYSHRHSHIFRAEVRREKYRPRPRCLGGRSSISSFICASARSCAMDELKGSGQSAQSILSRFGHVHISYEEAQPGICRYTACFFVSKIATVQLIGSEHRVLCATPGATILWVGRD
jgi:hypothetical protein